MAKNENILYIALAIIIVLAVVGARVLLSGSGSHTYDISVSMARNGTGTLYPYQTVHLLITLTNNGSQTASDIPLGIYVNGAESNYSSYALPAHQSITIPFNYTYTRNGTYFFQALADPGDLLQISNRTRVSSGLYLNSSTVELANPYVSIPNQNITYTESFSASGQGAENISLINGLYNISGLSNATGLSRSVTGAILRDLAPYIANANGAYSKYSNGTETYAIWLQGTLTPEEVNLIVSSFNHKLYHATTSGNSAFSPISNTVSLCSSYSGGYTKIVELYNNSLNGTCAQISQYNYSASESNVLVQQLKSNKNLTYYRSGFLYLNSTGLSNLIGYDGRNLSVSTLFLDQYGVFMSRIKTISNSINLTSYNNTCAGLIYSSNGVNVCSTVIPEVNGKINASFGLVDSKYITPHYSFDLYSLVTTNNLLAAHYNAANLISRLLVNETSLVWQSRFKNICSLTNSSLGCELNSFNQTTNNASITITDENYSSIRLTAINCAVSAGFPWRAINYTLQKNQELNISTNCRSLPLPGFVVQTNYELRLNFTYNGRPISLNGTLNATT